MNECQISALDGIVNLGSSGGEGAIGAAFGLAFAAVEDLGRVFAGRLTVFVGVAFFGSLDGVLDLVPTGDTGAVVAPTDDSVDGPLLVAFGILEAVRSSSIFQRAGPVRQPVPRVIISP